MSDADRITDRLAKITEQFGTAAAAAWLEGAQEARQDLANVPPPEPPQPSLPKSQEQLQELRVDDPDRYHALMGRRHPTTGRWIEPTIKGFDATTLPTERQLSDQSKARWAAEQRELKQRWTNGERDAIEVVADEGTGSMSFRRRDFQTPRRG